METETKAMTAAEIVGVMSGEGVRGLVKDLGFWLRTGRLEREKRGPKYRVVAGIGEVEEILRLHRDGVGCWKIAEAVGLSFPRVRALLVENGCEIRKPGNPTNPEGGLKLRAEELRGRYRGGETLVEIGREMGVTRERVRQVLGLKRADGGVTVRFAEKRRVELEAARSTMEYWRGVFRGQLREAGWRRCRLCGEWDEGKEVRVYGTTVNVGVHLKCAREQKRKWYGATYESRGWQGLTVEEREMRCRKMAEARWGKK